MNPAFKKRCKETVAGLSRKLRFPSVFLGLRHPFCGSMQTVILLYHRVVPQHTIHEICSLPQIVTPLDHFEAHLDYVSSQYHVLSMGEFEKARQKRSALPLKTAVITFDDGWEDNYSHALPALKRRGIPATIFLSTANIGTGRAFWQEQMVYLLQVWQRRFQSGEIKATEAQHLPPALSTVLLPGSSEREVLRLIENLKHRDDNLRASLLSALNEKIQNPPFPLHANGFMNWRQVREMHTAGIEFGSHAHSHHLLTTLSQADVAREVRESKKQIETILDAPVTTFAYPNGNYNNDAIAELKAAGYRLAATTRKGINTAWTSPFELRRINVNGALFTGSNGRFSADLFALKLSGRW